MKKYIFPVGMLIFVIALTMGITRLTQPERSTDPKIIAGWKHITFDQQGNSYYINVDSITADSWNEDEDELKFHATFLKLYSDRGRKEMIKAYGDNEGVDVPAMEKVDHEIDVHYFRDLDGVKFLTSSECKFYTADNVELPTIEMKVSLDEDKGGRPIPSKGTIENLYDYAFNRVKK